MADDDPRTRRGEPPAPSAWQGGGGAGQPPYGQPPYGQPPYGQPPYGQPGDGSQGHAPQGYGPPPGYGSWRPPGTNGLAVASLVLGILWLYWIGSILALVFGYVARRQIRERGDQGRGMATAGIVLGWIGIGVLVVVVIVGVVVSTTSSGS